LKRTTLAALFEFSCRAAAGLVLAAPITAAVAATGIGAFPEGDRLLFEPGGLLLVEAARSSLNLVAPLTSSTIAVVAIASVALSLPQALLWTAAAEVTPEPFMTFVGRAGTRVPSLLALLGLGLLSQVLAGTLGLTVAGFLRNGMANPIDGDLWALGVVSLTCLAVLALGIVRDVASAAVACGADNARQALRFGAATILCAPGTTCRRWLGPAALGLALVGAVAAASGVLDVARPGTPRLVAVLVLHQGVLVALSFCRAAWFVAAVRLVRPQLDPASAAVR
jgi:hypothetical protein